MTRRLLVQALTAVPTPDWVLRLGALLPPSLRSRQSARLLTALASRRSSGDLVVTNMGIATSLRCRIPATHFNARFGKPSLYEGESAALDLATVLCRDADAFFDIGAHLGYFTLHVRMNGRSDLPVYFFEPDPHLFELLETNIRANHLRNLVGYHAAIGSSDRSGTFNVNHTDSFSGSLTEAFADRHDVEPIPVAVRSFASVATEVGCRRACVKVDVENAEWEFLQGASGSIDRIAYLIMEVLGPAHSGGFVQELTRRYGFEAYYINDYRLEQSLDGSFEYSPPQYNWLFCREDPDALGQQLGGRFTVRPASVC